MSRLLRGIAVASLLIPGVAYITISLAWDRRHVSSVNGDEPHYLIIADAIARDHTVDVRAAYDRDAVTKRIAGPIDWENHSRSRPEGTFSIHDIGLPVLIAPIFRQHGLAGVRVMLSAIAGIVPFLLFAIARRFEINVYESIVLALGGSLGLPFLATSGQVYPDLVSGVALLGLATVAVTANQRPLGFRASIVAGLVLFLLPWLHIKNVLAAAVIGTTIAVLHVSRCTRGTAKARVAWLAVPLVCSVGLLAWFNNAAFGHVTGGLIASDAAGATLRQASMIFLGLHLDQLQGVFIQQPLFILGLLGLPVLGRREPVLCAGLGATYLAVILPNSFHACWYGCASMGGRFMWSVAALWFVPLAGLYRQGRRIGRTLIVASSGAAIAFQMVLLHRWNRRGSLNLFSQTYPDSILRHSLFAADWRRLLPSFVDFEHYTHSLPNSVAAALALSVLALGVFLAVRSNGRTASPQPISLGRGVWMATAAALLAVIGLGWFAQRPTSVDLIALFPRAKTQPLSAGPATFSVSTTTIAHESMAAILARAPTRITWTVAVPDRGVLRTTIGLDESTWSSDGSGVVFRIGVSASEGYRDLFTAEVEPHARMEDRRWIPVVIDLSDYEGREVQIIFNTGLVDPNDRRKDLSNWGAPTIRSAGGWE